MGVARRRDQEICGAVMYPHARARAITKSSCPQISAKNLYLHARCSSITESKRALDFVDRALDRKKKSCAVKEKCPLFPGDFRACAARELLCRSLGARIHVA